MNIKFEGLPDLRKLVETMDQHRVGAMFLVILVISVAVPACFYFNR